MLRLEKFDLCAVISEYVSLAYVIWHRRKKTNMDGVTYNFCALQYQRVPQNGNTNQDEKNHNFSTISVTIQLVILKSGNV